MLHANAVPGKNVESSPLPTPETRHCPAGYADHWTTIRFPPPMGFSAHAWGVIGGSPSIHAAIIDRNSQILTQWAVRSLASVAQALVYHSTGTLSQGPKSQRKKRWDKPLRCYECKSRTVKTSPVTPT